MAEPAQADLLISGGMVVTVDPAWTGYPDGAIAVVAGEIIAVGPRAEITTQYRAARTMDGRSKLITPGLITPHPHAPMVLYRGLADALPLMSWLEEYVWPAEAQFTSPEAITAGATLAAAEMIAGGTTCFADMYF